MLTAFANRDVLVSGIGIVTSLGIGKGENWKMFCEGVSGISPIRGFDTTGLCTTFGSEVSDGFEDFFSATFPGSVKRRSALFTQLYLAGAHLALKDSGIELDREDPASIGICVGTGGGGQSYWEQNILANDSDYSKFLAKSESLIIPKYMPNAAAAMTSLHFGIEGPSLTVSASCSSGAYAIGCAFDLIRLGRADVVIAGGVEAAVSKVGIVGFNKLNALSERNDSPQTASRPFDKTRDGFVLGEGTGVLILESSEHCRKRRAKPYAKILACTATSEAHHLVQPADGGEKMARTIRRALEEASVSCEQVDYISAHGTSTPHNDRSETAAIKKTFQDHAYKLAVSSQKSMIGHAMGASGAIEAAVTVLTVAENIITPTINYEHPDPECDLDYVPNAAREKVVNMAISNSFGFGGHNSVIVISKP